MGSQNFDERTVVISGGAMGIGFACARRFVSGGARVVIVDIDEKQGKKAASELGVASQFIHCDVGDRGRVEVVAAQLSAAAIHVDTVINNAGIHLGKDFFDLTGTDFQHVLTTNVLGAFNLTQVFARQMIDRKQPKGKPAVIINMASINATVGLAKAVAYCTSKGAMLQLTRSSALALAPYGIRVNAVGPGAISTEGNTESQESVVAKTPMGRKGTPAEIADVVGFLASEEASYITGQIIYVDGGRLVLN